MSKPENKNHRTFGYQIKTFGFAFTGIKYFFSNEIKAKIHLAAAIAVVILGIISKITFIEWFAVIVAIAMVFITEMINSAIERLVDLAEPNFNVQAGIIKDIAAGAVLVAALASLVIGFLVFDSYVLNFIKG